MIKNRIKSGFNEFDKILIGILRQNIVDEVISMLRELGISKEKILRIK